MVSLHAERRGKLLLCEAERDAPSLEIGAGKLRLAVRIEGELIAAESASARVISGAQNSLCAPTRFRIVSVFIVLLRP
jgi:hypothetical protein